MKTLIIFLAAAVAIAVATPVGKIGRCSLLTYNELQGKCTRKMLHRFKRHPNGNCNKYFYRASVCYRKSAASCLDGYFPKAQATEIENSIMHGPAALQMKEFICGTGEVKVAIPKEAFGCDQEAADSLNMVVKRFLVQFRHKRSDPNLCAEFGYLQRHAFKILKTRCVFPETLSWYLDEKNNPFCMKHN